MESDEGTKKRVVCDTTEQFMNIMKFVNKTVWVVIILFITLKVFDAILLLPSFMIERDSFCT